MTEDNSRIPSGTFTSIEEAERAIGFLIPHARELGAFKLDHIRLTGGTRVPGNTGEPHVGQYGHDRTEWMLFLSYKDGPGPRSISIFMSPRTQVELVQPTGIEPLVHGQPVIVATDPRVRNPSLRARVSWVDHFEIHASTMLESPRLPGPEFTVEELRAASWPVPGIPLVKLEEFLDFVRSVR